jgi:Protein of unknown function (DUF1469).
MNENMDIGIIWDSLKENITELINTRLKLLRLEVYEKVSTISSTLIFGIIIINVIFFTLLFGFIALGFLFSEWLNNLAGGFGMVVGIYLILFTILILLRKKILRWMENIILKELYPDQKEKGGGGQ